MEGSQPLQINHHLDSIRQFRWVLPTIESIAETDWENPRSPVVLNCLLFNFELSWNLILRFTVNEPSIYPKKGFAKIKFNIQCTLFSTLLASSWQTPSRMIRIILSKSRIWKMATNESIVKLPRYSIRSHSIQSNKLSSWTQIHCPVIPDAIIGAIDQISRRSL